MILFDVMNTLVREPFFADVPGHFGMTLDELLAAKHPTSWFAFERGEIDETAYFEDFFRDRRPIRGDHLLEVLVAGFEWLPGMEPLLADLHAAGHTIHALSNYPAWYRLIDEKLGLSRYLSWTFVSCKTGVRKPDAEAYLGAARALGVSPAECLFIDDQDAMVAGARAVGMPAIQRTTTQQLSDDLRARRLLGA